MEERTPTQIREHYEIERRIADRLRSSSAAERRKLYSEAYDELFRTVTHHPMIVGMTAEMKRIQTAKDVARLAPLVNRDTVYLEIGPGDCAVAFEISRRVAKVYAIDVSNEITKNVDAPENFELIISDGSSIELDDGSVDVAFSNQLMEHLHEDDALPQLRNVFRTLKKGGKYLCITPNRLSGPHDISRNFDDVATGLHLREYSYSELGEMFRKVGFSRTEVSLGIKDATLPLWPFKIAERIVDSVPHSVRKFLTFNKVVRFFFGVRLIGTK